MQNRHIAMGILLLSLLLSSWLYWGSDFKLEQVLTSREWQSKMVSLIKTNSNRPAMGPLSRVDVTSNVKYLPNGTYLRVSIVKLFSDDNSAESALISPNLVNGISAIITFWLRPSSLKIFRQTKAKTLLTSNCS
ncbi:Transmembrane regulatory protein ToxS [Vibrio cholerae]|nr:Transmembrane regulatory protein ToxS [Vibrio cholerae]